MHISNTGLMTMLVLIMLCVSFIGGHFLHVSADNGGQDQVMITIPQIQGVSALNFLQVIFDSMSFFLAMTNFSIEGMPAILSVMWIFMQLMIVWCVAGMIRGSQS